ncbi:hypothetical protein ACFY0R_41860, partial [Streptomyces sp. NPDC001633]|uniref:hypothetical protein n=1 Tax=Streptomyces sp. NPDC001633 TaxID=3364595 RepID=UPI0036AD826B
MVVLSYSGEVYNFREIRDKLVLLGHRFRLRSDTEGSCSGRTWGGATASSADSTARTPSPSGTPGRGAAAGPGPP